MADASPRLGLRIVGLLPCAVWTPKAPKITTTIRPQIAPYTTESSSASRLVTTLSNRTSTITTPSSSSCHCSHQVTRPNRQAVANTINPTQINPPKSIQQQLVTQTQANPSSSVNSINSTTAVNSSSATATNNTMLLVPVAMPAGFSNANGFTIQPQPQQYTSNTPNATPSAHTNGNNNMKVIYPKILSSRYYLLFFVCMIKKTAQTNNQKLHNVLQSFFFFVWLFPLG